MTEPLFFKRGSGLTVRDIAALAEADLRPDTDPERRVDGVATLDRAGPRDLTFLDTPKFAGVAELSSAGICLTSAALQAHVPAATAVLIVREPYRKFVEAARTLFPEALQPSSMFAATGVARGAHVHPSARLENDITIDPGAVVGPGAEIGSGTVIGPCAVVGPHVRIGRNCLVGANATLAHAIVGDRVVLHPGCHIGQDGFGFVMGPGGHRKVPQIGRVIIQNDVEIGAGTTIDRGALRDTVIGERTKIDNLVQVGHNVTIGRNCIIVAQTGISGSVTLEDWVVLGGQVGIADHLTIGEGAQVGASSGVMNDIPPGAKWFGTPAKPGREMFRELATLHRLSARPSSGPAKRAREPDAEGTT